MGWVTRLWEAACWTPGLRLEIGARRGVVAAGVAVAAAGVAEVDNGTVSPMRLSY